MTNKYKTVLCPHCETENLVRENGRYVCNECQGLFDVDWFPISAIQQPDDDSCGWATTLWLLRSFGALDVTPAQLRRELNTDAKRGIRALWNDSLLREWIEKLGDWDLEVGKGTLPLAIYSAISKRGLTLKNPIRAESPTAFKGYLKDTFRAGGRAVMLLWRMDGLLHWLGVDEKDGKFRVMDPGYGAYFPFHTAIANWNTKKHKANFVVVGIVRG